MTRYLKRSVTALAAFVTLASVAAPAEARWRRHRDNDDTAIAIGAGIIGLGIVAALASSSRGRYYDRRYDDYYDDRYYNRGHGYNDRGYYDDRYYRRHRYGYRDCYTRRVWDPYWGRTVRVRYCDRY